MREVLNYVRALQHGLERVNTLPVSLRLIRELHERLMDGVRGEEATPGEFRLSQNWIGRPGCTLNQAAFIPPPVPEMRQALDAFEKYLHEDNTFPPLIRLAFIHYQFEAIHPFLDGNGRIGRLLLSLLLANWKLLPLPLLYLSAFFERYRQDYYDLLLAVSERGAWKEWLLFFLRGVAEQSQEASRTAKQLQDLQADWRAKFQKARGSALLLKMVDLLLEQPLWTIPQMQKQLGVSFQSAQRNLEQFEKVGIVREVTGGRYGRLYMATEVLRLISLGPPAQEKI